MASNPTILSERGAATMKVPEVAPDVKVVSVEADGLPPTVLLEKAKLIAEKDKLVEEITGLKALNITNARTVFHNEIRTWVALIGGLITGIGVIGTIWIQGTSLFDQRERESEFRISKEVMVLVDQLSDPVKQKRENAAIMLSFFGEQPVPILLNQLENLGIDTLSHAEPETIRKSLELIIAKADKKTGDKIVEQIVAEAHDVFQRELEKPTNITAVFNLVDALVLLKHVHPVKIQGVLDYLETNLDKSKIPSYHRKMIREQLGIK